MPKILDITGQKFGRLTAIRCVSVSPTLWLCNCECGNSKAVRGHYLRTLRTQSCGCINRERSTKHGMYGTPEYNSWASMVQRCCNPAETAYDRYGGRGITVCERWRDFSNFYADMGPRPSARHSLDRIENERGYEPGNCRWATDVEQNNNRRNSRLLTHSGRTQTLSQWSRESGVPYGRLKQRLDAGWTMERALAA